MRKFKVLSPIHHPGLNDVVKDGIVEMEEQDAAPLVKSGSLVAHEEAAPAEVGQEAFGAAIKQLTVDDTAIAASFDKNGVPTLKALESVGLKLKGPQRDALWAEYQGAGK